MSCEDTTLNPPPTTTMALKTVIGERDNDNFTCFNCTSTTMIVNGTEITTGAFSWTTGFTLLRSNNATTAFVSTGNIMLF